MMSLSRTVGRRFLGAASAAGAASALPALSPAPAGILGNLRSFALAATAAPSTRAAHYPIDNDTIDRYERDGAVVIRGVFGSDWIEPLRAAVEDNMANPGPLCDEHGAKDGSGRFHDDQFLWTRHDTFRRFIFESHCASLAKQIMRSNNVNLFYDQILVKEPGTKATTPWHNDGSYWQLAGDQVCSVWVALDSLKAENTVQYIAGSHKWKFFHRVTRFDGEDSRYAATLNLPPVPPLEEMLEKGELLKWDMEPGDVLVHQSMAMHGASGNTSMTQRRRGYTIRWTGDDARYDLKPGTMHYAWVAAGYDPKLPHGAKLGESELFPTIDC